MWGADADEVEDGLWGYNSALTALATSVFLVPLGPAYAAVACLGAVAASGATLALKLALGSALKVPCLTLPFCAVASCCVMLGGRVPGVVRAGAPHSPEVNLRRFHSGGT
ncbi:unnamed protein product [Prorocentrum cordatum]|uniref:Dolichyl-diphosphooligosaccharide--protein glycotransferase n=1 Tax=Prorocentrum cordatum TaxID=2364126 RepID=A0ABN9XWB7_9DINO|nr:unnamed protein product [Polarella glacialis]